MEEQFLLLINLILNVPIWPSILEQSKGSFYGIFWLAVGKLKIRVTWKIYVNGYTLTISGIRFNLSIESTLGWDRNE